MRIEVPLTTRKLNAGLRPLGSRCATSHVWHWRSTSGGRASTFGRRGRPSWGASKGRSCRTRAGSSRLTSPAWTIRAGAGGIHWSPRYRPGPHFDIRGAALENDLDICGLDDDKQLVNAESSHLVRKRSQLARSRANRNLERSSFESRSPQSRAAKGWLNE